MDSEIFDKVCSHLIGPSDLYRFDSEKNMNQSPEEKVLICRLWFNFRTDMFQSRQNFVRFIFIDYRLIFPI